MREHTISAATEPPNQSRIDPDAASQREDFIVKGLQRALRGVAERDARKIARTSASVLMSITGTRRRANFLTDALQEHFGGVVRRDARKIACTVIDMNARYDALTPP
jgi:hypothetical protein